ncbi:MAG: insulinase family protein, partial [Myxococcota bacterium]
ERTLGALPARDVPEQPHQVPKPSKDKTRVVYGDNASVSLVWPTVAMSHADVPAIAVMNQIFSDGDNGLLEAELIRTHEIAGGGSGGSEYREGGVWTTGAAVRPDQEHATVSASLQRVVKRLLAGDFSEEAVAAVKLQFELQDMWRLESRSSRSYEIQQSIVAGGTWRDRLAQRKRYAKVTKEDVVRVANKYLSGEPHVVRLERGDPEVPKLKSPKITPLKLDTGSKSPFAQSLVDQKVEPLSPAFASAETDFFAQELPGGRFVAVPNEVNELVTVMYSFDIGGRDDPLLCPSLDAMEIGGTSGRTASELQDEFGRLGAQPWIYCGTESSGIGFLTFDRNLAATTALLHEWARDLVVDDEAVRAMTHSVIEERKDHYTNARALAAALSSWALLGDESPYRQRASNAELGTLTGAAAAKRTRELLRRPHRTMYYGGRTIEDAAAILALPKPDLPIPEHAPRKYRHRKKPTVFLIDKKLAKSDVRVLVPMPSLYDSRDPESYLFDEYYDGGMDSLLFQEIREARALAYSVWASTENPDWPGDELALRMGVQTAADKTTLAAAALLEVLARPIDAKRYQRVKRGELQSMRRWRWEPRSLAGRVETWEQLGLKGDPRRDRWDRIQTVEAADLEAFRTKVTADAPVITIVGDREAMDEKTLAKMGKVVTVEPKSLFSYE